MIIVVDSAECDAEASAWIVRASVERADGSRVSTYRVDAPEAATREDLVAAIALLWGDKPSV